FRTLAAGETDGAYEVLGRLHVGQILAMARLALQVIGAVTEAGEIHAVGVDREQDEDGGDGQLSVPSRASAPDIRERDGRENRDRQERMDGEPGNFLARPAVDRERGERPEYEESQERLRTGLRRRTAEKEQRPQETDREKKRRKQTQRGGRGLGEQDLSLCVDRESDHRHAHGTHEGIPADLGSHQDEQGGQADRSFVVGELRKVVVPGPGDARYRVLTDPVLNGLANCHEILKGRTVFGISEELLVHADPDPYEYDS